MLLGHENDECLVQVEKLPNEVDLLNLIIREQGFYKVGCPFCLFKAER